MRRRVRRETKLSSHILSSLFRMFGARVDRDGQAAALESSVVAPSGAGDEPARPRDRRFGIPREILDRSLSEKVLGGWLQNRHQVLVPLTFRLGRLEAPDVDLLMRFGAVSLLNASAAGTSAQRSLERALRDIGATEAAVGRFRAALENPEALSSMIAAIRERELSPYGYAITVMAADDRLPAGRLFADFIAARLELPADAVRSIDRRYRR